MSLYDQLLDRAQSKCELCGNEHDLSLFEIQPVLKVDTHSALIICNICRKQLEQTESIDPLHWRCLNESMWSEHLPVQIIAWRLLNQLKNENWARELLEQMYLDDEALEWAKQGLIEEKVEDKDMTQPTFDSHGTQLIDGDSVTLIKDLDVKGGGFTAKRGTLVKNISLTNNPKHIEGKVNGIQIVLISAYLKKA
jgi:protein PhnA